MLIKTDSTQKQIIQRDLIEKTRDFDNAVLRENTKREADTMAADGGGMDITSAEQRMGRSMSAWTFQQKLQKIREFLVFEKSNADPSITGIYIQSRTYDPALYRGRLMFVCGMGSAMMPEFSIIETEEYEVPTINGPVMQRRMKCETRGWRSVLAALLKARILSAHDVEKNFQISLGKESERWHDACEGGVIQIYSKLTEETNGGKDQRGTDSGRGSGAAPDDGRSGEPGVGPVHASAVHGHDTGIAEARRRDDSRESGGGEASATGDAANDRSGEDRDGESAAASGELLA